MNNKTENWVLQGRMPKITAERFKKLCLFTILLTLGSSDGGSIKIKGPKCSNGDEDNDDSVNCSSSVLVDVEGGSLKLGNLCTDEHRLRISILREDVDVEGQYSPIT